MKILFIKDKILNNLMINKIRMNGSPSIPLSFSMKLIYYTVLYKTGAPIRVVQSQQAVIMYNTYGIINIIPLQSIST